MPQDQNNFKNLSFNRQLLKFLRNESVVLAYLFGSQARGTAHRESDIDIGVLFNKKVYPKKYLKLEGKLLYQRNKLDRIFFQVQTLHEYEDYLHLNNIYNQFLNAKLKTL